MADKESMENEDLRTIVLEAFEIVANAEKEISELKNERYKDQFKLETAYSHIEELRVRLMAAEEEMSYCLEEKENEMKLSSNLVQQSNDESACSRAKSEILLIEREKEILLLNRKIEFADDEINNLRSHQKVLSDVNKSSVEHISALELSKKKLMKQAAYFIEEIAAKDERIGKLEAEIQQTTKRAAHAENEKIDIGRQIKALQKNEGVLTDVKEKYTKAKQDISNLKSQVKKLESENKAISKERDKGFKDQRKTLDKRIADLEAENATLVEKMSDIENSYKREMAALQTRSKRNEEDLVKASQELEHTRELYENETKKSEIAQEKAARAASALRSQAVIAKEICSPPLKNKSLTGVEDRHGEEKATTKPRKTSNYKRSVSERGGKTTEKYHPESKKQYQSAHQDIERDKHANTASDTGFFESEAEGIFSGDQKDTENTRTKEIEEEKEWEEALSSPEQQGSVRAGKRDTQTLEVNSDTAQATQPRKGTNQSKIEAIANPIKRKPPNPGTKSSNRTPLKSIANKPTNKETVPKVGKSTASKRNTKPGSRGLQLTSQMFKNAFSTSFIPPRLKEK